MLWQCHLINLYAYLDESYFLHMWQVNKLRIEADGSADDAPEMHHVEGAFVETVL
jgi:UDP-glucose:glycoprotein glucosyltransferase